MTFLLLQANELEASSDHIDTHALLMLESPKIDIDAIKKVLPGVVIDFFVCHTRTFPVKKQNGEVM